MEDGENVTVTNNKNVYETEMIRRKLGVFWAPFLPTIDLYIATVFISTQVHNGALSRTLLTNGRVA